MQTCHLVVGAKGICRADGPLGTILRYTITRPATSALTNLSMEDFLHGQHFPLVPRIVAVERNLAQEVVTTPSLRMVERTVSDLKLKS